jgi:hypothetical protein
MLDVARHTLKMGDSTRATTVVFAGVQLARQAHKIRRGELPDIKQDLAGQLRQLDLRFPAAIPTSAPNYRTRWLRQVRWRRAVWPASYVQTPSCGWRAIQDNMDLSLFRHSGIDLGGSLKRGDIAQGSAMPDSRYRQNEMINPVEEATKLPPSDATFSNPRNRASHTIASIPREFSPR